MGEVSIALTIYQKLCDESMAAEHYVMRLILHGAWDEDYASTLVENSAHYNDYFINVSMNHHVDEVSGAHIGRWLYDRRFYHYMNPEI